MDKKIEKLLELSGNKNRYQYFTLAIFVFLWINCNFIIVVLPYLEREPLVTYTDSEGVLQEEVTLTNEICEQYNYTVIERFKYSMVSEFDIECDKKNVGFIGSFSFVGNTAGALSFTVISKLLSHKNILIVSSIGFCLGVYLSTIIKSFDYFYCLLACFVSIGLFGNCLCYSSLVVSEETVSHDKRAIFNSVINIGYSLCGIIYSLVFYFTQDWRTVYYILIGASGLSLILICVFVYDSPREYINKRDIKNTLKILEGIASFNGRLEEFQQNIVNSEYREILNEIQSGKISDEENKEENKEEDTEENSEENNKKNKEHIEIITEGNKDEHEQNNEKNPDLIERKSSQIKISIDPTKINLETNLIQDDNVEGDQNKQNNEKPKINLWSLFKYKSIRNKFIILNILWIGTRASFNGISLSSKSFQGNFYFNIIILYIIESISYFISGLIINIQKLGRKGSLWILYTVIIITFIILAFIAKNVYFNLSFNFIARFCASAIEIIYYTYSIEVYPTPVRSVAFGINAAFGNGGSIIAPMLLEFLPYWLFLTIFAGVCGLNAFLIIFLPETVGKPMIETIDELEK